MLQSPGSPEYKKLKTTDDMCGYLEIKKSQVSLLMVLLHVIIYARALTNFHLPTCAQEAEKTRQYDKQLKQMRAERDKAEKVLMEQLKLCGEEDEEESERSRQLIQEFQKKVNKSVKDKGTEPTTKKKTKSQPKKNTKKKSMKKENCEKEDCE